MRNKHSTNLKHIPYHENIQQFRTKYGKKIVYFTVNSFGKLGKFWGDSTTE